MHEGGADDAAFSTAVGAGETGSSPHAVPGDRRIEVGETVVVDAGCRVNGYCSDCTRTFVTGQLPAELEEAYAVVLRAQLESLKAVVPGADGKAVDRVARGIIEDAGFGDRFGHGSVTASASRCTKRRGSTPSWRARSRAGTSSPWSRACTSLASAAYASRTWSSSRTTVPRC